jgi:hypothetical protein
MESEGPGIWNRIAMLRRYSVKRARLEQITARFESRSHDEILAAIARRAELLGKVDVKSRERWPDAGNRAHAALFDVVSKMFAATDEIDKAALPDISP